jgi:hypothetical protein
MPQRGRDITLNGQTAYWPPELLELGERLTAMAVAGEITPEQAKHEAGILHEFMVIGCTVVPDDDEESAPEPQRVVEQNSETFRIPDTAVRQLEMGADTTLPTHSDPVAAEAAAAEGMGKALRADRVQEWKAAAVAWLAAKLAGFEFAADDLVAAIGLPDEGPAKNNVVGGWMNSQAQAGRIEFTGRYAKSSRVARHANTQRVWRVV